MTKQPLELRMYFFVPYQLKGIQQAIQAGHAALEYARKFKDDKQFINFVNNWKTWIILNGGTTNEDADHDRLGTMQEISDEIVLNKIKYAEFYESDLNDALTAICFICNEKVFNFEDYPNWKRYIMDKMIDSLPDVLTQNEEELEKRFPKLYKDWLDKIGGKKNAFLKELIRDKNLA